MGKRTAQRDINKDITSDSQVKSYFPHRWSPASLTFNIHRKSSSTQPWFDEECRELRQSFYSTLNKYRSDKSPANQASFVKARSNFKKTLRQERYIFVKEKTSKSIVSKSKNVKEYWKILKDISHLKSRSSTDVKMFSEIFKP